MEKTDLESRKRSVERMLTAATVVISMSVVVCYVGWAAVLVAYPYDWTPDAGKMLDWARRMLEAPETLYPVPLTAVPFPLTYTPLLTVLLAPVVALSDSPFLPARLLMLFCAAVTASALFILAGGKRRPVLGLAAVALALSPFNWTVYLLLVRVDGLMIALLFAAAAFLLPRRLERGCDVLGPRRVAAGATLLVLAVLAKQPAALIGAPLVLVWFLVDFRSARNLSLAVAGGGSLVLVALQLVTSGGFLRVTQFWVHHGSVEGQVYRISRYFTVQHLIPLSVLALVCVFAVVARTHPWSDSSWTLALAGITVISLLAKPGAYWSYFLVLSLSLPVVIARLGSTLKPRATSLVLALCAALLAASRVFPAPSEVDRNTADALYTFVREAALGRPLLAFRPDYAYFVAEYPVEVEASGFYLLAHAGVPGTELVAERVSRGYYSVIMGDARWMSRVPQVSSAIVEHYRPIARCDVAFFHLRDPVPIFVLVPLESRTVFNVPVGARCANHPGFPGHLLNARRSWPTLSGSE